MFDLVYPSEPAPLYPRPSIDRPGKQSFPKGEVLPLVEHPVIYNGDICTPADARRIAERFPTITDMMIGRGVLYRPTLPLEIAGTMVDAATMNRRFAARLMEEVERQMPTEQSRIRKTKEYWCLVWRSLSISEVQARQVLREQDYTNVKKKIFEFLQ